MFDFADVTGSGILVGIFNSPLLSSGHWRFRGTQRFVSENICLEGLIA